MSWTTFLGGAPHDFAADRAHFARQPHDHGVVAGLGLPWPGRVGLRDIVKLATCNTRPPGLFTYTQYTASRTLHLYSIQVFIETRGECFIKARDAQFKFISLHPETESLSLRYDAVHDFCCATKEGVACFADKRFITSNISLLFVWFTDRPDAS